MRVLHFVLVAFGLLYLVALGPFVIGALGLFGNPSGPLAGIFLIPLGLPGNLLADAASEQVRLWVLVVAPAINVALLALLYRWRTSR
jgi:hypothetical protein